MEDTKNWGHEGVMFDDVNYYITNQSTKNCGSTQAINPRTGRNLTRDEWNNYLATLIEDVNKAHPDMLISTNTHYFQVDDYKNHSTINRGLTATDVHLMEIGFFDPNLHRGSYEDVYGFADFAHNKGAVVYYMDNGGEEHRVGSDVKKAESFLANYFMVNEGGDFISIRPTYWDWDRAYIFNNLIDPQRYWNGWDTDLGDALGPRTNKDGVYTREFENGKVVVNEPDAPTRTIQLGRSYKNMNGQIVTSVRLDQQSGAVFLNP